MLRIISNVRSPCALRKAKNITGALTLLLRKIVTKDRRNGYGLVLQFFRINVFTFRHLGIYIIPTLRIAITKLYI